MAVAITTEAGRVSDARIIIGGIAPVPYRSSGAEDAITGQVINQQVAETAAMAALGRNKPLRKNAYKVPLTQALVKRVLLE